MSLKKFFMLAVLGAGLTAGACGGAADSKQAPGAAEESSVASTSGAAEAPAAAVTKTGNVIEVKMITDGEGNYFEPANFTAKRGDLIKFVLVSGVHNVSFPAAENQGKSRLPAPSEYLQLPGQAFELLVDLDAGKYFYQCDPHAALGMVGEIVVEE